MSFAPPPLLPRPPPRLPPLSLSLGPSSVDASELSALLAATGQNCLRFPSLSSDGLLPPVCPSKLEIALQHSTTVVSMHVRGDIPGLDYMQRTEEEEEAQPSPAQEANLLKRCSFRRTSKRRLVAFGRATSDHSLTASIHDLAVAPSMQKMGLGRKVLQRIIRDLGRQGICDIAVLVSPQQRPFFQCCGFAPDILGSTTMLYTRSVSPNNDNNSVKQFGRKYLLVPSPLKVPQILQSSS